MGIVYPTIVDGIFIHHGHPIQPIGFNYWPSSSGVACWREFDLQEWDHDFAMMSDRGFNAVRFFLLWPDFQPSETEVDEARLNMVRQVVELAAKHQLWTIPTLFQGWMSGTNFDPAWRAGRNHISDSEMRKAMALLVKSTCLVIRESPNILAIDLANEIDVICPDVTSQAVASWTADLRKVAQSCLPGVLVTNGTADTLTQSRTSWNYEDQTLDFGCLHGYPMFYSPLLISSLRTTRSSVVFGSLTALSASFGPVMREEYGTAIGGDGSKIGNFVRASTFASYLGGANGFLYWCWKDFATKAYPYQGDPFETSMGYLSVDDVSKEWSQGLDDFLNFFVNHPGWKPKPDRIGIYIPKKIKEMGEAGDRALAIAYETLVTIGFHPVFTHEISQKFEGIIVPCTELCIDEITSIDQFSAKGGGVVAIGISSRTCGQYWEKLTGFRQEDIFRSAISTTFRHEDQLMNIPPYLGTPWPVFKKIDSRARVWIKNPHLPIATVTKNGMGKVVQFIPPATGADQTEPEAKFIDFWRTLTEKAGLRPRWKKNHTALQVSEIESLDGQRKLIVINHSEKDIDAKILKKGLHLTASIKGKGVALFELKSRD